MWVVFYAYGFPGSSFVLLILSFCFLVITLSGNLVKKKPLIDTVSVELLHLCVNMPVSKVNKGWK